MASKTSRKQAKAAPAPRSSVMVCPKCGSLCAVAPKGLTVCCCQSGLFDGWSGCVGLLARKCEETQHG